MINIKVNEKQFNFPKNAHTFLKLMFPSDSVDTVAASSCALFIHSFAENPAIAASNAINAAPGKSLSLPGALGSVNDTAATNANTAPTANIIPSIPNFTVSTTACAASIYMDWVSSVDKIEKQYIRIK